MIKPAINQHVKHEYGESGVYVIRDENKNVVYVGKAGEKKNEKSKPRQSFDRMYRHFQSHNPSTGDRAINHEPYSVEGYEVRIIQVAYPNSEKLYAIEDYFNEKYKPRDSYETPEDLFMYEDERPEYQAREQEKQNLLDDDEVPF